MALIPCRHCGKQVREQDAKCWNCGNTQAVTPANRGDAERQRKNETGPGAAFAVLGLLVMVGIGVCWSGGDESSIPDSGIEASAGGVAAPPAEGIVIPVPGDPARAQYYLLDWKPMPKGRREALTRRDGKLGTSYARREIDCRRRTFRYLGEGDTRAEAEADAANPGPMAELVPGSISTQVADFVCRQ